MICILARGRKPDYYEKLKTVLAAGRECLQQDKHCIITDCTECENYDICMDLEKAIMFIEQEQLSAEMKAQKKLQK